MFNNSIPPGYGPELASILTQKYREISPLFQEISPHLDPSVISFIFRWIETRPNHVGIMAAKDYLRERVSDPIESIQEKCRTIVNRCPNLLEKVAAQSVIKALSHHIGEPEDTFCQTVMTYFTSRKSQLRLHEENYLHNGPIETLKDFILSRTIIDSPSEETDYMRDIAIPYFCAHPDLRHVMQAYAKILATRKGNIFILNELPHTSEDTTGYYSQSHSIFINKAFCRQSPSTLVHECLHAIMNHVYCNGSLPYYHDTDSSLILKLDEDLEVWNSFNKLSLNEDETLVLSRFKDYLVDHPVYFDKGYNPSDPNHVKLFHLEAIVRIMEARADGIPFSTIEKIAPNFFRHYRDYCKGTILAWSTEKGLPTDCSHPLLAKTVIENLLLNIKKEKNPSIRKRSVKMLMDLINQPILSGNPPHLLGDGTSPDSVEKPLTGEESADFQLMVLEDSEIDIETLPNFSYLLEYFLNLDTRHVCLDLFRQFSHSLRSSKYKKLIEQRINRVIFERKANDFLQKHALRIMTVCVLIQFCLIFYSKNKSAFQFL